MANIFSKLIDAMKFSDDDEDEYNEYLDNYEEAEKEDIPVMRKTVVKEPVKPVVTETKAAATKTVIASSEESKKPRIIADKGKVVPLRNTNKDLALKVIKPSNFSDCQDICDILLNGDAVIVNLEGFDAELSQRVMDFVSGTVYAIKGQISPVSQLVYIISPENVTISGDVLQLLTSGGVEAPTFSQDF